MRTILRDNYTPEIGDYHECLVVDEPEKKIWLFDCDGVYSDISPVTVVSELGDSEKYAASQKLVTGLNSDLWTEVGVINNKIAALATDFSYKGSVEDYYHLPDDAAVGDVYTTLDTGIMYVWDGNQWVALNEVPENEVVSVYTDTAIVSGTPLTLYSDEECTDAVSIGSIVRNIEAGKSYQIIRVGDAVDEAYLIYPVISARDDGTLEDGRFGVHIYDGRSLFYLRADLASATELTVSGKLIPSDILDEPGSSYTAVMSQAGVTNLVNRNAGAPTSTTEGTVGSLIEDTTNGKLYICTNVDETDPSNPVYTWDLVGKDTFKLVTPADYGTTGKLEYWNLQRGLYQVYNPNGDYIDVQAYQYIATGEGKGTHVVDNGSYLIVGRDDRNNQITVVEVGGGVLRFYQVASTGYKIVPLGVSESYVVRGDYVINNLTSTNTMSPLSANQGKVLNEKIESRVLTNAGAPTTSTVGTVGQLLEDTTNGKVYVCTAVTPQGTTPETYTYTWTEVATSASMPSVVQVTGDSTTSVMSQDATSKMVFRTRGSGYPWDPTNYVKYINIGGKDTQTTVLADGWGINIGGYGNGGTSRQISDASVTIGHGTYAAGRGDVIIGNPGSTGINSNLTNSVVIGNGAGPSGSGASLYRNSLVTIGYNAQVPTQSITGAVAIGACSYAQANGEMNIGSTNTTYGYNSSNYRLLTGVYDPINAHVAATKGYVDTAVSGAVATINSTDWSNLWQ